MTEYGIGISSACHVFLARKTARLPQDSLAGYNDGGRICRHFVRDDMDCEECTVRSADGKTTKKDTQCSN